MAGLSLHHVQLTCPIGRENDARQFYGELLGLKELPKPADLIGRGGVWFQLNNVELHIGVEPQPDNSSKKRHWAFLVEQVETLRQHLIAAGFEIEQGPELTGVERFFVRDPFGNRLEFTNGG